MEFRESRLRFDNPFQHDLMEVRPIIPTIATRDVHDLCVGDVVAVLAAIDMEAGTIELHKLRGKAQTLGCCGRNEPVAFGDTIRIERI